MFGVFKCWHIWAFAHLDLFGLSNIWTFAYLGIRIFGHSHIWTFAFLDMDTSRTSWHRPLVAKGAIVQICEIPNMRCFLFIHGPYARIPTGGKSSGGTNKCQKM